MGLYNKRFSTEPWKQICTTEQSPDDADKVMDTKI